MLISCEVDVRIYRKTKDEIFKLFQKIYGIDIAHKYLFTGSNIFSLHFIKGRADSWNGVERSVRKSPLLGGPFTCKCSRSNSFLIHANQPRKHLDDRKLLKDIGFYLGSRKWHLPLFWKVVVFYMELGTWRRPPFCFRGDKII